MTLTYKTTKQFIDWLREVRPVFGIDSDYYLAHYKSGDEINCYYDSSKEGIQVEACALITTDTLHDILWELFNVENPVYRFVEDEIIAYLKDHDFGRVNELRMRRALTDRMLADALWQKYTSGKESMWKTDPDQVLEDIINEYKELNN